MFFILKMEIGLLCNLLFLFGVVVTIGYQMKTESSLDNLYKDLICIICMRWRVLILLGVFFVSFAGLDLYS